MIAGYIYIAVDTLMPNQSDPTFPNMRLANNRLVFVFLALVTGQCLARAFEQDADEVATVFANEIRSWVRSGNRTKALDRMIDELALPVELKRIDWRAVTGPSASSICTICKSLVKSVITMIQDDTSVETIVKIMTTLCIQLNLQTERVCLGIVQSNMPIVSYIVVNDPTVTPSDVCGIALQHKLCSTTSDKYEWTVEIDENSPEYIAPRRVTNESIQIVQITDIHYDPLYEPNGNSQCDEPTCCRKGQNVTLDDFGKVAGYWGSYDNCDSPWHAVVDALTHIKDVQRDAAYVYFTGDIIDHGIWETTMNGNIESMTKSYNEIKNTFRDIPVYPILGNHEPHPLNAFAPEYIQESSLSSRWLYELAADLWISYGWLPESSRETILRGGFYTLSPRKGFRIIALNNNVCYIYNWWLIYHPKDPGGQLSWLAETLLKAERNNEYVHILAHIPPGSQVCHVTWSREFRRIVNRFARIITGQFNGHTHYDELNVFYDPNDPNKAINVAWNGGSVTPYSNLNPNYKVYTANGNTFAIERIDTWIYNLTAANETPEERPLWYKSYSFTEEYGLDDLSLSSLHRWLVGVSRNTTKLNAYRKNYHKYAEPGLSNECDADCMKSYLCNIVITNAGDKTKCEDIAKV